MLIPVSGYDQGQPQFSSFIKREISFLEGAGAEILPLYVGSRYSLKENYGIAREVARISQREKIQVIHVQTGTAALFSLFGRKLPPMVITLGGSEILGYPAKGMWWKLRGIVARWVSFLTGSRAARIIAVSPNIKQKLPQSLRSKTVVLPRAVNTSEFQLISKHEARSKLGWEQQGHYVIFSNPRLGTNVKNLPLAEEVIRQASLQIVQKIHLEIIQNKSPEEVVQMMNAADALLVTSYHEGSPNVVKEAMACNLPVVSVPCGDVPERLQAVQPSAIAGYDAGELAAALLQAINKGERSNGREILIKQGLDRESTTQKMMEVYQSLHHQPVSS